MLESDFPTIKFDELYALDNLCTSFDSFIFIDVNFLHNSPIPLPHPVLKGQIQQYNCKNYYARPAKTSDQNSNDPSQTKR
jgi:hypothetical protein